MLWPLLPLWSTKFDGDPPIADGTEPLSPVGLCTGKGCNHGSSSANVASTDAIGPEPAGIMEGAGAADVIAGGVIVAVGAATAAA